jgi:hypothetical protein
VADVASQTRWIFPLLNAHGPGAELSLATRPGRVLYAPGGPGGSPYPMAVRADGTVHWAAGRAAVVAGKRPFTEGLGLF